MPLGIQQLLIAHPADKMETFKVIFGCDSSCGSVVVVQDQQGLEQQKPFWSLPRRLPTPVDYCSSDDEHIGFVVAYAVLLYRLWKLPEEQLPANRCALDLAASTVTSAMEPAPFEPKGHSVQCCCYDAFSLCSQLMRVACASGVDVSKFKEGVSAKDLKNAEESKFSASEMSSLVAEICEGLIKLPDEYEDLQLFEDDFEKDDDST